MGYIMAKPIEILKEVNKIDEDHLEVDLNFRIKRVKAWFISNIFGRALSYLVGYTGTKALMLRCTSGGILKVSSAGTIFEINETKQATSVDAWASIVPFTGVCSSVDIWVFTNDITFVRSPDASTYWNEFKLKAGDFYSFDASTKDIKIKSTTPGSHGTVQVIGWR